MTTGDIEECDTGEDTGDDMSMPEEEEILEEPKEVNDVQEAKETKRRRRYIKPKSPEPLETVTLKSHRKENAPEQERVIEILSKYIN